MRSQPHPIDSVLLLGLLVVVSISTWSVSKQNNPENATLSHLREAGSIKIVVYDPHQEYHRNPSAECPDRHFRGYIPRIRGIKAVLTVSQIASRGDETVVREQAKKWAWRQETELRNEHLIIQPIAIKQLTPGTYRARLTVEKNGEKISLSGKTLLTIPDQDKTPAPLKPPRRTPVRRFL
ncbi:MAG: hypothetical protein WAP74_01770 [Patescibacteria group bacterium]